MPRRRATLPKTKPTATLPTRYPYLDQARALFMLLGIVFHTVLLYQPSRRWVFMDTAHDLFFGLGNALTLFRMPGFFLISGFACGMLLSRHRPEVFLRDRAVRLGVPLLFCGLAINPFMDMLSTHMPVSDFKNHYLSGKWMSHLWFLGNLLAYCVLAWALRRMKHRLPKIANASGLSLVLAACLCWSYCMPALLEYLSLPKGFIILSFPKLFWHLPYFLLGFYLYHQRAFLHRLLDRGTPLLAAIAICGAALVIATEHLTSQQFLALQTALLSYLLVFLILYGLYHLRLESPSVQRVCEASYTIYLLHQPILVTLAHVVKYFKIGFWGVPLLCLGTFMLSYAAHVFAVRQIPLLGLLLNGRPRKGSFLSVWVTDGRKPRRKR